MTADDITITKIDGCTYYRRGISDYHRLDGPAVAWDRRSHAPGYKAWWVYGKLIGCNNIEFAEQLQTRYIKNNKEFLRIMKLKVFL